MGKYLRESPISDYSGGFTLLEMIVVLAILGLAAAVVAPQLEKMFERIEFAANRDRLESELGGLLYEAFRRREDIVLATQPAPRESKDELQSFSIATDGSTPAAMATPILPMTARLSLPDGWQLTVETPILFRPQGICSGGDIRVRAGGVAYDYQLLAPLCRPVLK